MAEPQELVPGAEGPEHFTGLKLGIAMKTAAGIPAVLSSFRQIMGEAGFARGMKGL